MVTIGVVGPKGNFTPSEEDYIISIEDKILTLFYNIPLP